MKSTAPTIKSYIEGQPDEWRPTLRRLRTLCRRELVGYEEDMSYGMPSYSLNSRVEVAFAKQSKHLALYILKKPVLDAHRGDLVGLSLGKGCIRYRRSDQLDWEVVTGLLTESRSTPADICQCHRTGIVGSAKRASALGGHAWRNLQESHDSLYAVES